MKRGSMRIVMVISQFYPFVGGAERQAHLLSSALLKKGVSVKVITGWLKPDTARREIIDGVPVYRNFCCWGMFGIRGLRPVGGLLYMLTLLAYLLIHRRDYDLIHVHQALYPAFVGVVAGKLLHKPVVVKTASSGITSDVVQIRRFPFGELQLRYLLKNMESLVAISRLSGQEYVDLGFPKERIVHIPNGTRISSKRKTEYGEARRVVAIGRLSREKGMDVLLRAWKPLIEKGTDLKLILLGDGPEKSRLRSIAHSLSVSGSVEFLGNVESVSHYLEQADVFVLPSRTEGMSNALLEAMSYGVPCVATNVGGNVDILHGMAGDLAIDEGGYFIASGGVLVRSEDVSGLAAAIVRLIEDHGLRRALGGKARKLVEQGFSIDRVTARYMTLYEKLKARRSLDSSNRS